MVTETESVQKRITFPIILYCLGFDKSVPHLFSTHFHTRQNEGRQVLHRFILFTTRTRKTDKGLDKPIIGGRASVAIIDCEGL